ncbi:MAG TPA: zinc-binding dehydrogenase [Thermoleophilia bacterium]|nr:zinc-binding dehydrogenase [Thermoleophilia bacterium]
MKTVAITRFADPETNDKGQIEVVDFPMPSPGPTDVLVKVAYASICGSDPHILAIGKSIGWGTPFGLGHEVSGTVVDLGPLATVTGLKIGDKVTGNFFKACGVCERCRNGQPNMCVECFKGWNAAMAEYVLMDEQQVFRVHDSVSLEEACLTEPLAISMRAVEKADIPLGGKVAISGGGSLGLMIVQLAKMAGASEVTIIEPVEAKLQLARELGADYAINPKVDDVVVEAMKITGNAGFDSIIESSGAPAATKPVMDILAIGGTAVFFAMYPTDYELPINLFTNLYWKEQTVRGFINAPFTDFARVVQMMPRMNMKSLIHKVFPIEEAKAAFDAQSTGQYAKILIRVA